MPLIQQLFRCAVLMLLLAGWAAPAMAQDAPLVGVYALKEQGREGELTVTWLPDAQRYHIGLFTTTDGGAHFCDFEGNFIQEEKALVLLDDQAAPLPMIILDQGNGCVDVQDDRPDSCGMGQRLPGIYCK